jgi:hypothetical protein
MRRKRRKKNRAATLKEIRHCCRQWCTLWGCADEEEKGRREGIRKRKDNAEEMVVEEKKEAC